jgi:CRISPR-associated protein Csb2
MIAIDVEFLTGRYVATSYNDRSRAEWPPHPARLYSALVAAWAEEDDPDGKTAAALDWIAAAGPPEILADGWDAVSRRTVTNVYVPDIGASLVPAVHGAFADADEAHAALVAAQEGDDPRALRAAQRTAKQMTERAERLLARDAVLEGEAKAATIETALALLPSSRGRLPRTFPSITPAHPRVTFVWPGAQPTEDQRAALVHLLARVVRLGHSSSLVSCTLEDHRPDEGDGRARWVPDDAGDVVLRTVAPGQLDRLRVAYEAHREVEPRVLPCQFTPYRISGSKPCPAVPRSLFGTDWLVFREVPDSWGRRTGLRLTLAADIARALRATLMRHADQPPSEIICGHSPDGRPLATPHLAFLSLADVGTRWASGAVLGVALVLPRDCPAEDRLAVLRAVGRWEQAEEGRPLSLHLGRAGMLRIERILGDDPRATLAPWAWCGPARHWASVTPIALDENPGNLAADDPAKAARAADTARAIIARACQRIGLPAPAVIEITQRSVLNGCPEARRFMPFPSKSGAIRRVCIHAELIFEEEVEGPILLGAGRFQGLGLFRPVRVSRKEVA